MNNLARESIERIYIKKDYCFFKQKSKQIAFDLDALMVLICKMCKTVDVYNSEDDPAIEIWITYDDFMDNSLCIQYKTVLKISKVSNLFVFQHEFSVDNKDPNKMTPILDGFSEEAYTFSQDILEDKVSKFLLAANLKKIHLYELDEVIWGVEMPEKSIFGRQMTLENALFRDLYGICES